MTREDYKKEVVKLISYLEEIGDYLEDMDETAGIGFKVADAFETLEDYFNELLSLYK